LNRPFIEPQCISSIPQRLPVLQHVFDARLRLFGRDELHEVFTFEVEQPLLVHQTARGKPQGQTTVSALHRTANQQ